MNIVRLALKRPISIIVMTITLALGALMAVIKMPRDILPSLGIPTIYVVQPYGGMDPSQMESYITYFYEYHFLYISGIEHIESQNVESAALIKLQFYPGTDMAGAMSETVANVERSRAFMPPGTVSPFIIRYDAGGAPVGNLVFSGSSDMSLGQLQDVALNRVRPLFATLKGVSAPPPFGASAKTVVVSVDPAKMAKYNLAAAEVAQSIVDSNTITPSGNIPVGNFWPIVPMNAVVKNIDSLLQVPMRIGSQPTIFLKDIGTVAEGTDIPTCYALVNGKRTVYIPVTKRADASTLEVVDLVKKNLPRFQAVLPPGVKVDYEFDQSVYVRESIKSLVFEGVLGAILTGLMVLLFLRDIRSVAIVVLNIPLALMASLLAQWMTGQTVNVMTLGGLALAVGILVDETTVTIENIHVHLGREKSIARASLDATIEIFKPELITLLCVLSVFVPSFFMEGVARSLFVPLTIAVGFSVIGSFILSLTLVPVLTTWFLKNQNQKEAKKGVPSRFDQFRAAYARLVDHFMKRKKLWVGSYLIISLGLAAFLITFVGKEIFPLVNEGQFKVRLRAPTGSSLEFTEKQTLKILDMVGELAGGRDKIKDSLAFVGQQPAEYAISDVYQWTTGTHEAVLQVAMKSDANVSIENLKEQLRQRIAKDLPDMKASFEPSGLIDSSMSQGSPTPIEISITGPDLQEDRDFANKLMAEVKKIPYLRDLQFGQVFDYPALAVEVDRAKAGLMGLTVKDVGKTLVPATSSTRFTIPNFWSDPKSGINYQVQVEVPQGKIASLEQLKKLPVTVNQGAIPLDRFATVTETKRVGEYDRYNMQRRVTITANLFKKDLGHATQEIKDRLKNLVSKKPRGVEVSYLGQMKSMDEMFSGLTVGLIFAIVVIFLLLSVNFESFTVSFAILATIPAVLTGALGALVLTGSTLNIESYMGTIMAIGVAVANSILMVTFAERDRMEGSGDAEKAAVEGAQSRLRPILMTSCAMLIGMIPMASGLSEGGKQSAPLGRAVMGGLFGATLTTLFILPQIYTLIQSKRSKKTASLDPDDSQGSRFEGQISPEQRPSSEQPGLRFDKASKSHSNKEEGTA
jgi:multidrug efflux pump subunit AcrB